MSQLIPSERIEKRIYLIRGQKVMLSMRLADLYEVEPRVLMQAVKRNLSRFPEDFMFQLTWEEYSLLKSQIVISNKNLYSSSRSQFVILEKGKNIKYLPYAFTEQGVAMLSSVLRSERAVQVNIAIMRAFVKLREMLASNRKLAGRLDQMERKYDAQFKVVFDVLRQLTAAAPATPAQDRVPEGINQEKQKGR